MPNSITNYQIRKIYAIGAALGIRGKDNHDTLHDLIAGMTGKGSVKELSYAEACRVIGELKAAREPRRPAKRAGPCARLRRAAPATGRCARYGR